MITLADVIRGITKAVEQKTGLAFTHKDIQQGFTRPCFFLDFDTAENGDFSQIQEDVYRFRLYYFCERRGTGYATLIRMRDKIRDVLSEGIPVDGGTVWADEEECSINRDDMVLITTFTTQIDQIKTESDVSDVMEEISIEMGDE